MSVHRPDWAVPALLASSSFGIPVILLLRAPPSVLASSFISLNFESAVSSSETPVFKTFLTKVLGISNLDPKSGALRVHSDLTWLEKVGFSRVAFTKMANVFLTCWGLSLIFLAISSIIPEAMSDAAWSTCVPPLVVQIPFTNDTCCIPSSEGPTHTDQRSVVALCTLSKPCIFA